MTNKIIGKYGEDIAKDFLIKQGFEILEMNYHYSKIAEIDIIASKKEVLHFIEVKTRTQELFGTPLEAITPKKLKQIYSCAIEYINKTKKRYKKYQIDAIGIILDKEKIEKIDFVENITLE
ncbi:MAG: YraN family protein [Candidatus Gastranaerophilales bacterium]|nr:YraN family protein [Candidatus Gastranaerophilales bacterium]